MSLFALAWAGGAVERGFRRRRPGLDALPWGTLRPEAYPAPLVARARAQWTDGAFAEFATAGRLAALLEGMVRVRAPVDLIGLAGDFVTDEMVHTELHARVLAELGGAVPYEVSDGLLTAAIPASDTPLRDVVAEAVRTCCVGETLSVALLAASRKVSAQPLIAAVLARLAEDEGPHAQLGWWLLAWAGPRLDAADREAIARAAEAELAGVLALGNAARSEVTDGTTSEGFALADVHALGWLDAATWRARAAAVVHGRIVPRLRAAGLPVALSEEPR